MDGNCDCIAWLEELESKGDLVGIDGTTPPRGNGQG